MGKTVRRSEGDADYYKKRDQHLRAKRWKRSFSSKANTEIFDKTKDREQEKQ